MKKKRIVLLSSYITTRGAHKVMLQLSHLLSFREYVVWLVAPGISIDVKIPTESYFKLITFNRSSILSALPQICLRLASIKPELIISATEHVNVLALLIRPILPFKYRTIITIHNVLDPLVNNTSLKARILLMLIKQTYPAADAIVCVSKDLRDRVQDYLKLKSDKVKYIYNPVNTNPSAWKSPARSTLHPFFNDKACPKIILAAGSLSPQKDFQTLISAIKLVSQSHDVRLIILGNGPLRTSLLSQVRTLGLEKIVSLPGFYPSPQVFFYHADLFVLSSVYEGFGLVLAEALAVGTNVVATNCPSGPYEILNGGELGRICSPSDIYSMAEQIINSLENPFPAHILAESAQRFSPDKSVSSYEKIILQLSV